jgi:hypothetical protein
MYVMYDPEELPLQGSVPTIGTSRRTNRGFSLYFLFAVSPVVGGDRVRDNVNQ